MKLAVLGLGYWGPNLVRVFSMQAGVVVVGCDRSPARVEHVRRLHPELEFCTSIEQVLQDSSVDAVVVALPAGLHFDVALEALNRGKDVLVEKPLAGSVAEAEELARVAEEFGRILMVGHTFLFNAAVREIKRRLDRGDLGEIYYVYSQRLNLGVVRSDVDVLTNLAPHDLSILRYWFGPELPVEVTCQGASFLQPGVDDVAFLSLRYASGLLAHLHCSWLDPRKVRTTTLVGSRRMVVYDDVASDARVQIFDKGIDRDNLDANLGTFETFADFQRLQRAGDLHVPPLGFREPLQVQAEHFVSCVKQRSAPIADAAGGIDVVRILEAARRSRAAGGKPVRVEPAS